MKIRTDQLTPLQDVEQRQRVRSSEEPGTFGEMLAQEVQKNSPDTEKAAAPPPGAGVLSAQALQALQGVSQVDNQSPTEQEVMDNIDSLLSQWENYAQKLSTPLAEESLRQAYGMLESIQSGVQQIKAGVPNLDQQNPSLHSMVNELEIMTVTEQVKFNRGDYS